MPAHQQAYYAKKEKELKEKLRVEKLNAEAEMRKMAKNMKKHKRQAQKDKERELFNP